MIETKPRHVLTEMKCQIYFRKWTKFVTAIKILWAGENFLFPIRISFLCSSRKRFHSGKSKFHSKVLIFEIFMVDKTWVCVMRSNPHDICINLGLSFCGQNFQVAWNPSSEAIEYRMQSLVNWNTDEYIHCFSLLWSRAVCWNWFKPENTVEHPRLRAGSRPTFADRESAIVIG